MLNMKLWLRLDKCCLQGLRTLIVLFQGFSRTEAEGRHHCRDQTAGLSRRLKGASRRGGAVKSNSRVIVLSPSCTLAAIITLEASGDECEVKAKESCDGNEMKSIMAERFCMIRPHYLINFCKYTLDKHM